MISLTIIFGDLHHWRFPAFVMSQSAIGVHMCSCKAIVAGADHFLACIRMQGLCISSKGCIAFDLQLALDSKTPNSQLAYGMTLVMCAHATGSQHITMDTLYINQACNAIWHACFTITDSMPVGSCSCLVKLYVYNASCQRHCRQERHGMRLTADKIRCR